MTADAQQSTPLRLDVSVLIAVRDGGDDLRNCLAAIARSSWAPREVVVVDDGSTDDSAAVAEAMGASVIRLGESHGPAHARNRAAEIARGDILFFTDADVQVHRHTIARAVAAFAGDRDLNAVIGSYDDRPSSPDFVAQYKNLFHHWVHQTGRDQASTFWTGCGAIRRETFLALGGFNEGYSRPSIEDIELGFRIRRAGGRIRLLKDMQATHSKRWRLLGLLHTDVFRRGAPWIALMMRDRFAPEDLNLSKESKVATGIAVLLLLSSLVLPIVGHAAALLPISLVALVTWASAGLARLRAPIVGGAVIALLLAAVTVGFWIGGDPLGFLPLGLWLGLTMTCLPLYRFFVRVRGIAFGVACAPMHILFQLCCAASLPFGILEYLRDTRRARRRQVGPGLRALEPLAVEQARSGSAGA